MFKYKFQIQTVALVSSGTRQNQCVLADSFTNAHSHSSVRQLFQSVHEVVGHESLPRAVHHETVKNTRNHASHNLRNTEGCRACFQDRSNSFVKLCKSNEGTLSTHSCVTATQQRPLTRPRSQQTNPHTNATWTPCPRPSKNFAQHACSTARMRSSRLMKIVLRRNPARKARIKP